MAPSEAELRGRFKKSSFRHTGTMRFSYQPSIYVVLKRYFANQWFDILLCPISADLCYITSQGMNGWNIFLD